jgi:hypothetical protein
MRFGGKLCKETFLKKVILILSLVCTACATAPDQTAEPREEKVYRTGSNIPVARGSRSDVSNVDPESVRDAVSRSVPSLPPGVKP